MSSCELPRWTEHPDLVAFYRQHRNRPEDLYPSERRFLPWLASQASLVLDVGCAAGGFRNIWRHYRPEVIYIGVDVSAPLVVTARRLYPGSKFYEGNCATGLPLSDRYADLVQALGWLHWEPGYQEAIKELWRLTSRYLFFDVRLMTEPDQAVNGKQQLALMGSWDGKTTTPYICLAWPLFAELLVGLQPITILGYGYWGRPAETVVGVDQEICFATFVSEKAPTGVELRQPTACIDLPLAWPTSLVDRVDLLPAAQLEALVPPA
ncbi:class I SAM-dependent methyltransferase [Acidobacteria bacterium AH-259-D05]|nr:class I SAM-dependent methyltransferase [Acidobacteria bacterium AH-259-D05]